MTVRIIKGDCRHVLPTLPAGSVHCIVTSPPYWGLRDYGIPGQIGLEPNYREFVEIMVSVFRDVWRVLRPDGTVWLNLGDTYASSGGPGWQGKNGQRADRRFTLIRDSVAMRETSRGTGDLKPKDLCGIPWRVALALQDDGWYLRQDIIWAKPNPMPESVTDRCTKAHEYLFLLSKSERYYFDQEAIAEECSPNTHARLSQDVENQIGSERAHKTGQGKTNGNMKAVARRGGRNRSHKHTEACQNGHPELRTKEGLINFAEKQRKLAEAGSRTKNNDSFDAAMAIMPTTRNKRSVWTVGSEPYSEAHFATFPPALIEPCILAGCPAGGLVLDPFGGAGTTGLVADRLGRDALLIELNPDYAAMAQQRVSGDSPLFAEVSIA